MAAVDVAMVQAVLFDLDGTLVDSDAAVERAWIAWADRYGVDPAAALSIAHGRRAEATVHDLLPDLDAAKVMEAARHQLVLQYEDLDDVVPAPGALRVLAALDARGIPWAVVTSADRRLARARLGAAGIAPSVLVTSDDVERGKPHPEGFLRAADLLAVPVDRCLVVEDSPAGLEAGRSSGALLAGVKGIDADLALADLNDLAEEFERSQP
jgi:sugar-phosphatase